MKFHLSPEQDALQDTIEGVALRACPPERRRALLEAPSDFDQTTWDALMEVGLGGLLVGEEHGGAGLGLEEAALVFEVLGRTATPGSYAGHVLAAWTIAASDDEELKARWLSRLASGQAKATLALGGWTPQEGAADAQGGALTGRISLVPGADCADLFVIGAPDGLAVVEAGPAVAVEAVAGSDLTRKLWTVTFAAAPARRLASQDLACRVTDAALVLVAADALGGAEQCLTMAVEYAKQREQFGVVIGQFQALKHQLANMALEVEPARALVWYAAYAWDLQLPDASRVAAHAKAHLADRFTSVTRMATQAHGGIGYTWDYDLQIWFRRSLFDRAFMGSPSLHRERIAEMAGW